MGLKDKVAKLDFSQLPGLASDAPRTEPRPKTAPGQMMAFANDARSELLRENAALKEEAGRARQLEGQLADAVGDLAHWKDAKATRLLDAELVVRSQYANRHVENFSGPEFERLKADIRDAGGNVQPIKVRVKANSESTQYEIVFGHRRHEACRQLGLPVLALVDNLEDRALFVEMDRENRARKDLSPWEQGVMYRKALDEKLFPSNRKLAEAIGVDLSALGKALALASLPDVIVAAFSNRSDLQFRWAKPLTDAWSANPGQVERRAKDLASRTPRLSARATLEGLMAGEGRGVEPFHPPEPAVVMIDGTRVARVTASSGRTVHVDFDQAIVDDQVLASIASALKKSASSARSFRTARTDETEAETDRPPSSNL